MDVWQETELINELIRRERQKKGYSQEYVSEGICSPQTFSRIESGSRLPNPNKYRLIMGKLSLSKEYYFSSMETSDYSVLEKKHNLERLIMCENWEDAERELYSLEKALSLDIPVNSQYVQIMKYIIDNDLDKIEPKDKIEILRQIL